MSVTSLIKPKFRPVHNNIESTVKMRRLMFRDVHMIGLSLWILYVVCGFYLTLHLHYYSGDAVSRVANAYDVLFGRNPHLGAIGFIWNPLPSIFELPIVAAYNLFPAVVTKGLAGIFVSSFFGAWGAVHLNNILKNFGVPRFWALLFTAIFALNPLILLYGANGMSDIMLLSCTLGTYSGVFDFLQTRSLRRLVSAGIWLAMGLGMRYEAVPFGALIIIGFILVQWKKVSSAEWIGSSIILGAPIVFSGGLWIYFNWAIMHNPLYFLNSNYGNVAQTSTGAYLTNSMKAADHSVTGTLAYVGHFTLLFWPLGLAFLLSLILSVSRKQDRKVLVLICGSIGAILLEIALAYLGHLGPWDRFFISFIPDGVLLTSYLGAVATTRLPARWRQSLWVFVAAILVSANIGTFFALQNHVLGHPDGQVIDYALANKSLASFSDPFYEADPVIRYLDAHPHLTVLVDSFNGWPIVIRSTHFNRFVITSDYDFESILTNPRGRVGAILVPQPVGVGSLNAVNRVWPGMWAGRIPWVTLSKSFPGGADWKLYTVTSNAP